MPVAEGVNTYVNPQGETRPINIYYTIEGPEDGEVVVFVTGLGCQLVHSMYNVTVAPLIAKGYRVLRYDNRDSGLSTKLSDLEPNSFLLDRFRTKLNDQVPRYQLNYPLQKSHDIFKQVHVLPQNFEECDYPIVIGGRPREFMDSNRELPHRAQYPMMEGKRFWNAIGLGKKLTAWDLADNAMDLILLLNHLNINKFHLQGVSMGGMISQYIASLIPSRILSLTLVFTSTGNSYHNATMRFLLSTLVFRRPPKIDAPIQEWIEFGKETQRLLGVPNDRRVCTYNNNQNVDLLLTGVISRVRRDEKALIRQMEAIDNQECRDLILDYITARIPTLFFHGKQDQLVPTSNSLHMFEIAKHSLERQLNPPIIRDVNDIAPRPEPRELVQVISNTDRTDVTTIIGAQYQSRSIYSTLCLLDQAAHDISDDFASFLIPQMLFHFDAAMGRVDIGLPQVLEEPQFGNEQDICFNVPPIPTTTTTTTATATIHEIITQNEELNKEEFILVNDDDRPLAAVEGQEVVNQIDNIDVKSKEEAEVQQQQLIMDEKNKHLKHQPSDQAEVVVSKTE